MILEALAFYVFSGILVIASVLVISARNPVHSVLYLILAFFNAAGLFVLLGAEFLAMILVIVYVGAVAVLFMFVVMMLDIGPTELQQDFLHYLPTGGLIGIILLIELLIILGGWHFSPELAKTVGTPIPPPTKETNTHAIGAVLYTRYIYLFQSAGIILLISMVGAIVLTHRRRQDVRTQKISSQVNRHPRKTVELQNVEIDKGI